MATEKRLISMDDTIKELRAYADRKHAAGHNDLANGILKAVSYIRNNITRVNAVELPYIPTPFLKDNNPCNTDVYCPECGTNLSGHYGSEPVPIITCFECGEIINPYKALTQDELAEWRECNGNWGCGNE